MVLSLGLLSGCGTLEGVAQEENLPSSRMSASPYDSIPQGKLSTQPRRLAAEAIQALGEKNYVEASRYINKALSQDITNSYLQFLNGFIYHQQALEGAQPKFPLAQKGYELAIQFDNANWVALYYMGILHLDQRKYSTARKFFAQAAFYKSDDAGILYNLAVASYYAQDPETAAGALKKLRALGAFKENSKVLRASSIVMAALNQRGDARRYLDRYKDASKSPARFASLNNRLKDWEGFYKRNKDIIQAQMVQTEQLPDAMESEQEADQEEEQEAEAEPEDNTYKMVIVDVVIIRTEETITSSKGINLINGLTLQFGSGSATSAAFSYTRTRTLPNNSTGVVRAVVRQLNIPSITYSLNIANANTTRNEILARPTLIALNGETSEFFSGINVNAAATGSGGDSGSSVTIEKDIGVKLMVTPEILEDGRVKMAITAERTFLTTPDTTSIQFTFRIDTSQTNVSANVVMNFGETLILSGLSEKETERKRDGVPGLQEIPLLQYLFSKKETTDFQKSVLILVTPRRPQFIYQSTKSREKAGKSLSREDRVLSELQARYSDWFRPYPNWASVFRHMQENQLYREFRTGDVALEKWENQQTRESRLKVALDFLYY
jgi:general secretion pathway protein D